jgi:hypothetical protein
VTVNGSSGPGHLDAIAVPAGVFAGDRFVEITDPAASPVAAVSAQVSNGSGVLSAPAAGSTSGSFGGIMGVPGAASVCLFASTCTAGSVVVPFTVGGTEGVGLGGSPSPHVTARGPVAVSVTGAGWTVGTVAQSAGPTTYFQTGFAHGPASGGLSSVAQGSGVISLVTPIRVDTSIASSESIPMFGRLTLRFAPEPDLLLLVGAALATLAALGRRRVRSQGSRSPTRSA